MTPKPDRTPSAAYSDDGEPVVSQEASASGRPSQVPAVTDTGATEAAGHPSSVLPNLISLTPEAVADAVAEWLTEQVADDTRAYGVAGPIDGRVILLLKGGELLLIDVNRGEVMVA